MAFMKSGRTEIRLACFGAQPAAGVEEPIVAIVLRSGEPVLHRDLQWLERAS